MPWRGPSYDGELPTLGWELLDWWSDYLPAPNDETEPLTLTDEQARLLLEWYTIDPATGRFIYRRGCSKRSKGWGKSPIEASKAIAELCGPVRFDGWNSAGEPVGRPWGTRGDPSAWVQIAAVSEDQTDNTYGSVFEFLTANDGRAADDLGIDVGLTRCYMREGRGKLEPVTASAGSREGQRVTYGVLDETHLWLPTNGGVKLARTIRRNVAKMSGRSYETTNAFVPGEKSVAEGTRTAVDKGAAGIYFDGVEAPVVKESDSDEVLRAALAVAYGDSHWVDLDRLVQDIRDPETPWEDSRRFFLNHDVDDRRKAVEKRRWDELARPDVVVPAGARIGVGFDGSISNDATALIGCTLIDGKPFTWEIDTWVRPEGATEWRVPRAEVRSRVVETFEAFNVGLMLCDPAKWYTEIDAWALEYGEERVVIFDTNSLTRMARACDRWLTAIKEGAYSHDMAEVHNDHALAMHRRKVRLRDDDDDGRTKFVFVKGPDKAKIDAGIADVLALEAFATMTEAPEPSMPMVMWR